MNLQVDFKKIFRGEAALPRLRGRVSEGWFSRFPPSLVTSILRRWKHRDDDAHAGMSECDDFNAKHRLDPWRLFFVFKGFKLWYMLFLRFMLWFEGFIAMLLYFV